MCMWYSIASDACYWCLAECEPEHEYISKGNKRDWFWLYEWQLECLWVFMCMYLCMCVCACGSGRGRAEKAFTLSSNSGRALCAGLCRRWQCRGLLGWLRGVTLLQRNKIQLQGKASDPSTCLHPPTTATRRRGGGVEGWGDFSVHCSLTLSLVQTREKNWKKTTITARHAA